MLYVRYYLLFTVILVAGTMHFACSSLPSTENPASTDGGDSEVLQDSNPPKVKMRASGPEKAIDPAQMGPYAVGVTTFRLTDPTRKDKDDKPRPMVIEVWYPAIDEARNTPTDAYDMSIDAPKAARDKIKSAGVKISLMKQKAHRDVAPLKKEGPYPLILFSHGSGGLRYQSVFQTAHLASHGYVVISVDHHGNTLYDRIIDSRSQKADNLLKFAFIRPLDVKFMFENMKKRNEDKKDRFFKMIDFKNVGSTGHSFGAVTSVLLTIQIKGISAIIPQTPHTSLLNAFGLEPMHVKDVTVMVMGAKEDRTLSYEKEEKAMYEKFITKPYHGAARHLVTLERGGHFSYSNICDLDLKEVSKRLKIGNIDNIISDGCATHNTPIQEAHRIINHYATALFNVVLRKSNLSKKYLTPIKGNKEVTYQFTAAP